MQPRGAGEFLAIIDCFDGPEGRNVAIVSPAAESWRYASTFHGGRKRKMAGGIERMTPVERFGVRLELEETANAAYLVVRIVGGSVATYHDGVPRRWQARDGERVRVNREAVGALRRLLGSAESAGETAVAA